MERWAEEVEIYREKIKGMEPEEASAFLWQEYYFFHNMSKRAYEFLIMFL